MTAAQILNQLNEDALKPAMTELYGPDGHDRQKDRYRALG